MQNKNDIDTGRRSLKITVSLHIPNKEICHRLNKAEYRLSNNHIDLNLLNNDYLSIRIKKIEDMVCEISAWQHYVGISHFKKSVHFSWPLYPEKNIIKKEYQLMFKEAQLKQVLDGNALPGLCVEITISIDKKEKRSTVQKDTNNLRWKPIA